MKIRLAKFGRNLLHAVLRTANDEFKELVEVQPTEEDYERADRLTTALIVAATSTGIHFPYAFRPMVKEVIARAIRDAEDGIETPNKLVIKRLINNYKRTENPL